MTGYPIYDASCVALQTVRKWLEENADQVSLEYICTVFNIVKVVIGSNSNLRGLGHRPDQGF